MSQNPPVKADRKLVTENLFKPDAEVEYRIKHDTERHRKGFVRLRVEDEQGQPVEKAELEIRQVSHAFKFGCNLFLLDQLDDDQQNAEYKDAFAKLFNQAVLPFYWADLEPEPGQVRFDKDSKPIYRRPPPDYCLDFCEERGIAPKGHPLLWHLFYPKWLTEDPKQLRHLIDQRFRQIAERYGDRIPTFDVCNEALACTGWHPLRGIGNHVDYAFELASLYFPASTTLVYNETTENSFEYFRGPHSPMFMLCEHLAERYRLGAVGLQFHLFSQNAEAVENYRNDLLNPRSLYAFMDQYASLGLPLKLSEITIPSYTMVDEGHEFQATVTERLFRIWFSHPAMDEIDWWNLVDGTAAYAPRGTYEGENFYQGGLLNYDMSPKPAYKVLDKLINEEWRSQETLHYKVDDENQFRGYYGGYEVVIKHPGGETSARFDLVKGATGEVILKV